MSASKGAMERRLAQVPVNPGTSRRWHYTIWHERMESIIRSGQVRPAADGVPFGEAPAVWFSANSVWEPTSDKVAGMNGSMTENAKTGGGLFRIEVAPKVAPYDWSSFRRVSGIDLHVAHRMEIAALRVGSNPADWYVSFRPVLRSDWLAVEHWDGQQWAAAFVDGATGT
jgi:hypothetical protein